MSQGRGARTALVAALCIAPVAAAAPKPTVQESHRPAESPATRLERLRREEAGPHPPSPSESAKRRLEIAKLYAAGGDTARALELLSEAESRDPDEGEILARLTLLHLQRGDFEFARAEVDEAADRADLRLGPPDLWNEAAEGFAAMHRVDDAIAVWELVESHGAATAAVSARLARARRELAATPGQRLQQGDRFTIYADSAIPEDVVARVESHLESENSRLEESFGGPPLPAPQVVVLYAGRRFFSLVSVPEWVSGVFDGKIRVSLETGRGFTPEVQAVLSHELAHAWIRFLSNDRAPAWLHEGLAQWCEGRRVPRRDLQRTFASRSVLTIDQIETNLARRTDFTLSRTGYVEALGLVEYVAQARGEGALVCLVKDLGDGQALEQALRRETGLSSAELVSRWRVWIEMK